MGGATCYRAPLEAKVQVWILWMMDLVDDLILIRGYTIANATQQLPYLSAAHTLHPQIHHRRLHYFLLSLSPAPRLIQLGVLFEDVRLPVVECQWFLQCTWYDEI